MEWNERNVNVQVVEEEGAPGVGGEGSAVQHLHAHRLQEIYRAVSRCGHLLTVNSKQRTTSQVVSQAVRFSSSDDDMK